MERVYSNFSGSLACGYLHAGSDLKKKETEAFLKIDNARRYLGDFRKYDNIQEYIKYCQNVNVELMEALRDL